VKPETVPLGEACIVVMGQSPPGTSYNTSGDGLPFFQGKTDFGEIYPKVRVFCNQPSRIAEEGDILISVRAPVGPTNLAKQKCCIGRGLAALRTGTRVDTSFLLYFLRHHEPRLASQGQGSTFDAINRDDLEKIEVPFPGLSEQRRIAEQLEQGDRLRRTRRYALELTDNILPAAFLELFSDDSFSRVALEELAADERNSLVNGPFGSDLLTSELTDSGVPVIYIRDISSGRYERTSSVFVTPAKAAELEFCNAKPGDVLVAKVGDPPGIAAIYPAVEAEGIVTQDVIRIRPNTELVSAFYLQGFLNSPLAHKEMTKIMVEGTRLRFSLGQFKEISVPVPPLPLQQKFAASVEQVERLRAVQREALRQAEHLFTSLLHRAFGG
jgi:type I restriction enzyme S subunit